MKTITANINGKPLTGQVSDMDALFFAGLLLPTFFEIRDQEKGLKKMFAQFSEENAETLAADSAQADEMYESWGERLLIRLTNNLEIRSAFAQRITEIFTEIDPALVHFDRWHDKDSNVHEKSRIRLDMEPCMSLVTSIISIIQAEEDEAAQPAKPSKSASKKAQGFKPEPTLEQELKQARARVQELEAAAQG